MSELTPAQKLMVDDGLPASLILDPAARRSAWNNIAPRKEPPMKTETAKPSKADQVASLRVRKAEARGRVAAALDRPLTPAKPQKRAAGASKPKAAAKKAAKAKARTTASAKPATPGSKVIRPGSKLEIIVGLLTRKEGTTTSEILKACDWPAVSVPQMARSAGLTLRQEKDGKVTRYWAS